MSTPLQGVPWTGGVDDMTAYIRAANVAAGLAVAPFVLHGADADYERPDVDHPLIWIGSVAPNNAENNDVTVTSS